MPLQIRPETTVDRQAIWQVNRAAFDTDAEANLVDALRDGGYVEVSLVGIMDDAVVGHVLFTRLPIFTKAGTVPAVSLAPMAVAPAQQRRGIGSQLVAAGLKACQEQGHAIAVVMGHPEFYPKFGFESRLAKTLVSPYGGSEAWMAIELTPGALADVAGRVEYPPPFSEL